MDPKVEEEIERAKQYVEAQKVVFDYVKHITTLGTGSVLLLALLLEKFFQHPHWKWLIPCSFLGFICSIILLSCTGFGLIRSVRTPSAISASLVGFTAWTFIGGSIAFAVGIVSLAVFSIRNWM